MNKDFKNIEEYVKKVMELYKARRFTDSDAYWYEPIEEDPIRYVAELVSDEVLGDVNPYIDNVNDMGKAEIIHFATLLKSDIDWNENEEAMVIIRYNEVAIFNDPILKRTGLNAFDIYGGLLREARSYVFSESDCDYDYDESHEIGIHTGSVPFYKFMNIGQTEEYSLSNIKKRIADAEYVEFTEKMDGCFVQAYYDGGDVRITTACSVGGNSTDDSIFSRSFDEFFNRDCKQNNLVEMVRCNKDWTFMFEAIFDFTHQIVNYTPDQYGFYLIGMRNKVSGEIARYSMLKAMCEMYGVKVVEQYNLSFDNVESMLKTEKGTDLEGFVANIDGFLVKMKTEDYIELATFKKNQGRFEDTVVSAFDEAKLDDLLSVTPESLKPKCDEVLADIEKYLSLCNEIAQRYIYAVKRLSLHPAQVEDFMADCPNCIKRRIQNTVYAELNYKDYTLDFLCNGSSQSCIKYKTMMNNMKEIEAKRDLWSMI